MKEVGLTRRGFLVAAALGSAARAGDDERPSVTDPRATDGDERFEPNWDERLTLTVGPDGRDADLAGRDDRVIQAALGHVTRLGGGTVRLLPGTYTLRNPIVLPSRVRLVGSGAETVITKIPSRTASLADDSDWYDREITLEDARGFRVGDGVVLRATDPHYGGPIVLKRTLVGPRGQPLPARLRPPREPLARRQADLLGHVPPADRRACRRRRRRGPHPRRRQGE